MTVRISRVLLLSAAVALSACASKGEPAAAAEHEPGRPAPQVEHRAAAQPASGTICRSIGSVAGKGKNDAYMCKASAVLNSAEAREVLDPSIRVSYGSTGSSTNVSRQSHRQINGRNLPTRVPQRGQTLPIHRATPQQTRHPLGELLRPPGQRRQRIRMPCGHFPQLCRAKRQLSLIAFMQPPLGGGFLI